MTKALFVLSDLASWVVVVVSLGGAAAYPLVGPIHAEMSQASLSIEQIIMPVAVALLAAGGALLLLKRKALGIFLVMLPALAWVIGGAVMIGLWYGAFVALAFGTPLTMSYVESRHANQDRT